MEKTEITTDDPIVLNGLTIIPVVSLFLNGYHLDHFTTVYGVKNLVAFLVISLVERKAYRASGEEVSTDQLIEEFPDLKKTLERVESARRHLCVEIIRESPRKTPMPAVDPENS